MEQNELQKHMDRLLSAAYAKCHHMADAEDLVQETLLAYLTYLRKGTAPENTEAWLYTVMERKFYNMLRRKYQMATVAIGESFDIADEEDFVGELIREEESERIRQEVAYLSESYRTILVKHYFYRVGVKELAGQLGLPEGTVKSRLDFGRKQLKKGMDTMEKYTENSYMPESLWVANSGVLGMNDEPMSLCNDDLLAQNILILAYDRPVFVSELARAIGVAAAYVEPVVNRLVEGELMVRMGDGKVYTDFVIYRTDEENKYIQDQEQFVQDHFDAYGNAVRTAIDRLKATDFYSLPLERFMLIRIANDATYHAVDATVKPQVFPTRPNGGRWIAFGHLRTSKPTLPDGDYPKENYALSGERTTHMDAYLSYEKLQMINYESSLFPNGTLVGKYGFAGNSILETETWVLKLLTVIEKGIDPKTVDMDPRVLSAIPTLEANGFLRRENGDLKLAIPHLTHKQNEEFWRICNEARVTVTDALKAPMAEYIKTHKVSIPPHLKSVPEQKLTLPYEPHTMGFVFEAIHRGLHPRELGRPCPETVVVFD
ncbi:MAG: RNA polymerase sigma factor [Clostridia bacterium]|nr:RNA polymerase sigma factor [Clostridia bacterium]